MKTASRLMGLVLSVALAGAAPLHCAAETLGKPPGGSSSVAAHPKSPILRAASHCRAHPVLLPAVSGLEQGAKHPERAVVSIRFDATSRQDAPVQRALGPPDASDRAVVSFPAVWAVPLLI